jgi:hypothetical protein
MVRLRNVLIGFVLATGLTGCSALQAWHDGGDWMARWSIFHCDSCDDFPAPANGPGYSMMPGTYTGTTSPGSGEAEQPATSNSPPGGMPGMTPPPAINTPPTPPSAPPGPGADTRKD